MKDLGLVLILLDFISAVSLAPPLVKTVAEGSQADILCRINDPAPYIVWFRVLEESGMDFIVSVRSVDSVVQKRGHEFDSRYRISAHKLQLLTFRGRSDTGYYSCASLGRDIKFGPVTRLQPVAAAKLTPPSVKTTPTTKRTTTSPAPCVCPTSPVEEASSLQCSVLILAPLAGGCGLLLLLLLCTALYCQSVRTRRCPHHYRRRPRTAALDKQLMTNVHL